MLSDQVLNHLRAVIDVPDLSGTRYELVEELGRGGMGIVYLARDTALSRNVALKIVDVTEEARILASLEHPGIVPVHDAGSLADGRIYYAMKFVEGTRLDNYRAAGPTLADRLRTFLRICEPIAFAHSRGVIHRDLKPENIMIGAFGEVLVLDWGVAGRVAAKTATAAGTRGYMAPEQLIGIITVQADIYSLGKVLEYLLIPSDPKPVHAIAAKAYNVEPAIRYSRVTDLSKDVARFLDGMPVGAYRESFVERAARWTSRNKTLAALMLTYLCVRCLIFFFSKR